MYGSTPPPPGFGALTSSRTSEPRRVYKEGHLDLALNQHKGEIPYVDRCKLLKWPSLCDRRNYLSLIECYKVDFIRAQLPRGKIC